MAQCIAYRGPDGDARMISGPLALAQSLLLTTPQEQPSPDPVNLDGQLHIVADACLYNREELLAELGRRSPTQGARVCDRELILHAYRKWGKRCTEHLVGDFAFALWDAPHRRLMIARDPLGIRQLYYCRYRNRLLFATDLAALTTVLPNKPALNLALLEQALLLNLEPWIEHTAYQGILKLPPGHRLIAADGLAIEASYRLPDADQIRYRSDEDYVEHFREVFESAVSARLRCPGQVGLMVSGGVDSSTIAATAGKLYRDHLEPTSKPVFYSFAGPDCTDCDDWIYLQQLINAYPDWHRHLIDGDSLWALQTTAADTGYTAAEPEADLTHRGWMDVACAADQDNTRVILTGHGADELLQGDAYANVELLRDLPLPDLVSQWRYFKAEKHCSSMRLLANGLLKPFAKRHMPSPILHSLRVKRWQRVKPGWIAGERSPESIRDHPGMLTVDQHSVQTRGYHLALGGYHQRTLSTFDQGSATHHVEHRYPCLDTRVIELLARFPVRVFFQQGQTKWIFRQLTRGILPESLRNRTSYCTSYSWIDRGWRERERQTIQQLVDHSRAADLNLVSAGGLQDAWNRFWAGDDAETWHLSAWLNIESWLQTR